MKKMNIPVGISDFAEIRINGYYYVDKTGLIREILNSEAIKVTLLTRPRRFGKTLGMSMLANFFDIRKKSEGMFVNLEISRYLELCEKWMNQYPVLFLSFKDVDGSTFENAEDYFSASENTNRFAGGYPGCIAGYYENDAGVLWKTGDFTAG